MDQKKIIIHFVPGSYGHFLEGLINKSLKVDTENRSDFHWIEKDYSKSNISIEKSHNYEEPTDKFVIKITYDLNDTALINRNKWTKWPQNYEESKAHTFPNVIPDINETTEEIVTKSYFRSHLLKNIDKWNTKINNHTIEIPFKFFLLEHKEWIFTAKKFFNECQFTYESNYLETAYEIFQNSQTDILEKNKNYGSVDWRKKDNMEKANFVANLYYEKIYRDDNPVPPSKKYSNTSEMLASWVKLLDENNGVLNND